MEPDIRIQLLAIGNALNFRFWRRTEVGEVQGLGGWLQGEYFTGSMYLWRKLRQCIDDDKSIIDARRLACLDVAELLALSSDDRGLSPLQEGAEDRVANLRDLGQKLLDRWDGNFANVVRHAGHSLTRFVVASRGFRAYDDPICKLTLVNALMLTGSKLAVFREPLLPAIDYQLLKQLLRQRVLIAEPAIEAKLSAGDYLSENEALELRSAALLALLRAGDIYGLSGDFIDNQIWLNRTTCTDFRPQCDSCMFRDMCAQSTWIGRPLQLTRHY